MAQYVGTAGDDNITGTNKADTFDLSQGGNDTVFGNGGADVFYFGAAFTADDHIDGGTTGRQGQVLGKVELNGDYSAGIVFGAQTMVNIATLQLDGGHSYNLTMNATTGAGSAGFVVDASTLGASDTLIFDGSASPNHLTIVSRAGHAELSGSTLYTVFDMGGTLNTGDRLVGNSPLSEVDLSGDYSAGLVLGGPMLSHITALVLGAGTYNFTTTDDLIQPPSLQFEVQDRSGSAIVTFDGSAETDTRFNFENLHGNITGGQQGDLFTNVSGTLTSGGGNDHFLNCTGIFHLENSGDVEVSTQGTNGNIYYMGASLTAADSLIAPSGSSQNTVVLDGDYSAGLVMGSQTLENISVLQFTAGNSYNITMNDGNLARNIKMTIDGSGLGAGNHLIFDGSAETHGRFVIIGGTAGDVLKGGQSTNTISGGRGADTLIGNIGNDTLNGGAGQDTLDGGSNGNDVFVYHGASDSTGINYDTIIGFDVTRDFFQTATAVTGVDAEILSGALSDTTSSKFNHLLAAAADAGHLAAGHAVLFAPDSGTLAGHVFLVVDQNGVAGYQASQDLVIDVTDSVNIAALNAGNFH